MTHPLRRAVLCSMLLGLLLVAHAGAAEVPSHPFRFAISVFEPEEHRPDSLEGPCGLALDSQGDLYVANYYHDEIDVFGSSGGYIARMLKEEPLDGPCGLAVDSAGGLYVNNLHRNVVRFGPFEFQRFPPQPPPGPGTVIDSAHPTGLAIDSNDDVYVDDRTYVAKYDPSGFLLAKIGLGNLQDGYSVAVSGFPATEGFIYVADAATNTVKVFDPTTSATVPVAEIDGAGTPQVGFASLFDSAVAIDDSDGHLFVADNLQSLGYEHPRVALEEFNAEGDYRGQLPKVPALFESEPTAVTVDNSGGATQGDVFITSGNTELAEVYAYGPTGPAHTVTLAKTGAGAGTITSEPAGINCGAACVAEFSEGQLVTLFAAPDGHSAFAGWTVTGPGAEPCPGLGTCTVLLSANREVSANFEEPTQETLTMTDTGAGEGTVRSEPAAISCPPTCSEHFNQGRLVTLTATPAQHSRFVGWGGPDCDESTATTCKVEMSGAEALSAKFEPIPQLTLSVTKTGAGQGTITSSPSGISCLPNCSQHFDEGSSVTLTAVAAPSATFVGFSGGGCAGAATTCTVSMAEAESVGAEFSTGPESTAVNNPIVPLLPNSPPNALRPPAPSEKFTLSSFIFNLNGTALRISAALPGAGTLTASGKGLKPASVVSQAAGTANLRLALSGARRKALRRAKGHRLKVRVSFTFTPRGGGVPFTIARHLTFRPLGGSKGTGQAGITQKGDLFGYFHGGISPRALPRHRLAPISISISAKIKALSGAEPPALRGIAIEVNRAGRLDTRGLPICRISQIRATSEHQALAACGPAMVGEGSYVSGTTFPEQAGFPSQGSIVAFNSVVDGHRAILAHVYGPEPVSSTRIIVFRLHHLQGTYGTVLTGALPPALNRYGYPKSISLELHRLFRYRGAVHSYLSAACAAPAGIPVALFPFARTSMSFADGRTLSSILMRSCKVRK